MIKCNKRFYKGRKNLFKASIILFVNGHMNWGTAFKIACAPSKDSDQPAHPRSLIGVFAGHSVDS